VCGLQTEEKLQLMERIDRLDAQCQKRDANWLIVDGCLGTIEKDSSLSEVSRDAVQKARLCCGDSVAVDRKPEVYKLHNIGTWLLTADFRSVVRNVVIVTRA